MQNHDQQVAAFTAHIRHYCHQLSPSYINTVFGEIELGLVSGHRVENIIAVNLLKALRAMPVGSALKVLKNVREDLSTAFRSKNITLHSIRSAGRAPINGAESWNAWGKSKEAMNKKPVALPDDAALRAFNELEMAATWCVRQEQAELAG